MKVAQLIKPEPNTTLTVGGSDGPKTVLFFALCRSGDLWAYCAGVDNGWVQLANPPEPA